MHINDGQGKHEAVVIGYGNVGRHVLESLLASPDFNVLGVVRRDPEARDGIPPSIPVAGRVQDLLPSPTADGEGSAGEEAGGHRRAPAAILAVPTRRVPEYAEECLALGLNTVDCYDIHGESLVDLRHHLDGVARQHRRVAVTATGWDPGTDSMVRALMEIMAPRGVTSTTFGPGVSMGHTTAVKAVPGVKDALALTLPAGEGSHHRRIFVQLEPGADFETVAEQIKADPYFARDETAVIEAENMDDLMDFSHGVRIARRGGSGITHNQRFSYSMAINNPALTAQIMVAAARAAFRQRPGAYTMLEIPPIDFLPGDREGLIRRLV